MVVVSIVIAVAIVWAIVWAVAIFLDVRRHRRSLHTREGDARDGQS